MPLETLILQLRAGLEEEANPSPGQSRIYGRPHAHPRARTEPRYTPTGERAAGAIRVLPDCPSPVRGRCECREDGSWRPSPGAIRADALVRYAGLVPAERLLPDMPERVWVDSVYELGPDGRWRCRWPVRRALERQRGANRLHWAVANSLLRGVPLEQAWGSAGAPPDASGEAERILRRIARWAAEERDGEWDRRPRQWWDPRRRAKSEAQAIAERGFTRTDRSAYDPRGSVGARAGDCVAGSGSTASLLPEPVAPGATMAVEASGIRPPASYSALPSPSQQSEECLHGAA